jgi:hypothetical protein
VALTTGVNDQLDTGLSGNHPGLGCRCGLWACCKQGHHLFVPPGFASTRPLTTASRYSYLEHLLHYPLVHIGTNLTAISSITVTTSALYGGNSCGHRHGPNCIWSCRDSSCAAARGYFPVDASFQLALAIGPPCRCAVG